MAGPHVPRSSDGLSPIFIAFPPRPRGRRLSELILAPVRVQIKALILGLRALLRSPFMSLFANLTVTDLTGLWSCLAARQVAEVVVELDLCLMVRPVDVGECERIMGTLVEVAVRLSYSPLSRSQGFYRAP